jgi:hypothetical protein
MDIWDTSIVQSEEDVLATMIKQTRIITNNPRFLWEETGLDANGLLPHAHG